MPDFVRLLRRHNIAFVFADTTGIWPYTEDVTADFIYIRLHGDEQIYVSGYTESALDWWADRIRAWSCGREPDDPKRTLEQPCRRATCRDVYAYFDNDVKVRAPFDAMNLARRLGCSTSPGDAHAPAPQQISEMPRQGWPGFAPARATRLARRPARASRARRAGTAGRKVRV